MLGSTAQVRVFMESEDDALRAKEESARMISCVMRGDPQTVFDPQMLYEHILLKTPVKILIPTKLGHVFVTGALDTPTFR